MKVKGIAETKSGSELVVTLVGLSTDIKLINVYRYLKKELTFMCKVTEDTMISMSFKISCEEGEQI